MGYNNNHVGMYVHSVRSSGDLEDLEYYDRMAAKKWKEKQKKETAGTKKAAKKKRM